MNPESIVHLLEPLRHPDPISWWPPAPGWWVLAGLVIVLCCLALRFLWRQYHRGAALREARRELAALDDSTLDDQEFCKELAQLQRRLALQHGGSVGVDVAKSSSSATGSEWAALLNALTPNIEPFDAKLVSLHYQPQIEEADREALFSATKQWMAALPRP